MKNFYRFLLACSVAGLLLSAFIHARALLGFSVSQTPWYYLLHFGIFAILFPILLACQLTGVKTGGNDFCKIVHRGASPALRRAPLFLLAYFFAHCAWLIWLTRNDSHRFDGIVPPSEVVRFFSAGWIAFYGTLSVTFYSLFRRPEIVRELRRK